jgi:HSP20 family protein
MSITRWDPWGEAMSLRDAMDSLLQESFVRPWSGERGGSASLALDVEERGDDFVVTTPVPGIKPEDVELSVLGDTLRIRAERREERREEGEGQRWLLREQRYGAFERLVRLPSPVKADQANAEFRDGILTITLPKAEEARERRIPVRTGESQSGA